MNIINQQFSQQREAFDFLSMLCGAAPSAFLVAIPPDRLPRAGQAINLEGGEELAQFLNQNRDANIYYQVQGARSGFRGVKAKATDIDVLRAVHVDLDPPKETHDEAVVKRGFDEIVSRLEKAGCAPSAVIDSGGGYQLIWLVPAREASPDNREVVEKANHDIAHALGGDAVAKDIARLLRLPGTQNYPDARKRARGRSVAPARLLQLSGEFHEIECVVSAAQQVGLELGLSRPASNKPEPKVDGEQVNKIVDALARSHTRYPKNLDAKLEDALLGSQKLMARWQGESDGLEDSSRSGRDMSVANLLADLAFSAEEIAVVLRDRFEHGKGDDAPPKYFAHTALKAINAQADDTEREIAVRIDALNGEFFVSSFGGKTVVCRVKHGALDMMSSTAFTELFANEKYKSGGKRVSIGKLWFESPKRRQYIKGVQYCPPGVVVAPDIYNLWAGWGIEPVEGNCDEILDHIDKVIAAGDDRMFKYVLDWLAHLVQRPDEKPGVALVMRGREGTGKSMFSSLVCRLVGHHNAIVASSSETIVGRFNGHQQNKLLIIAEEAFFAGDPRQNGSLKSLITDPHRSYEYKNLTPITAPSYHRIIMNTNNDWAVPAAAEARRYAVCDVSDVRRGDSDYFKALARAIDGPQAAHFMAFLRARDISGFNPRHFPRTAGLVDQQVRSLTGAAKWLYNELNRCEGDGEEKVASQESWEYGDRGARLWPIHITAGALYNRYVADLKPFPHSRGPMDEAQFIKDLRKILPMMVKKRETAEPRRRYWQMPPLQQAKQAFEEHLSCDDPSALWLDMATDVSDEG